MAAGIPQSAEEEVLAYVALQLRVADHGLLCGQAEAARSRYQRLLQQVDGLEADGNVRGTILQRLAVAETTAGRYPQARRWQCLALDNLALGSASGPRAAAGLSNLAEIQRRSGDLLGALQVSRRVLEMRLQDPRTTPQALAVSLCNLGEQCRQIGRLDEAEALLREALIAAEQQERRDLLAGIHSNLGLLLTDLGRFDRALRAYREALDCLGGDTAFVPDIRGRILNNLAALLHRLGHVALARTLYRQAVELVRLPADLKSCPRQGLFLANLARVEIDLGNEAEAERLCDEAQALLGRDIGPMLPEADEAWEVLRCCYLQLGNRSEAARIDRRLRIR